MPPQRRRFFREWFGWASRSRLKPIIEVARMIKRHFENIISYLRHPITNAVTEGLNSRIQALKANARGFRSFANSRIRILFFCGKLDLTTHCKPGRASSGLRKEMGTSQRLSLREDKKESVL